MKVLLVGEGPHELSGALRSLCERTMGRTLELDSDRMAAPGLHAHHGRGRGYFKRAIRWLLEAKKRGYDALILVVDQDDVEQRSTEIDDAQGFDGDQLPRAFGVAIRSFDAWILPDEKALTTVLGYQVQRQQDPESIKDPKQKCRELLRGSSENLSQTEMYAAVAAQIDIAILEARCSRGYAPFAARLRTL